MNILLNNERLQRLIFNLYTMSGIWPSVFDVNGNSLRLCGAPSRFCGLINACEEGRVRCNACDARGVKQCAAQGSIYIYRCHAGACEVVLPVNDAGRSIAYFMFGQLLDNSPVEQQWEAARKGLGWYKGDMETLRAAYFELKQYTAPQITAYAETLEALTTYIRLEGIIRSAEYTDLQKLEMYLDNHYMERLTLDSMTAELHMGRTKLCAMAKKLSGGRTLSHLIAERRVNAAKRLLLQEDIPVSAVAERVGFNDYNYFTKVFKSLTGVTPSAFRKERRHLVFTPGGRHE